ncbi:hypothetical protein D3C76_1379200 [compost metagenome]
MPWEPEAAGTINTSAGPLMKVSRISQRDSMTSCNVYCTFKPSIASILANPRSPSIKTTRRPFAASSIDKLMARFVFPTPPFPLVTAITRTGSGLTMTHSNQHGAAVFAFNSLRPSSRAHRISP